MRNFKIILILLSLATFVTSCLLTKGHFSNDGLWIWNKDPSGKYNTHNKLQVDNANKWVDTVLNIPKLRSLRIEAFSKKWDNYMVNDSTMFFNLKNKELANYHSYYTFSKRLNIEPELLKAIVNDFDSLGLNRFYKEDNFLAFETVAYLSCCSKGYFYFPDTNIVARIELGDTIDFRHDREFNNFRQAMFDRFLVTKKLDNHWLEWQETN